jgi:hypothetical protein
MFDFCGLLFFARLDDGRKIIGSSARRESACWW